MLHIRCAHAKVYATSSEIIHQTMTIDRFHINLPRFTLAQPTTVRDMRCLTVKDPVTVTLCPVEAGQEPCVIRTDISNARPFVLGQSARACKRHSALGSGLEGVRVVEHLSGVLALNNIHASVEINGPEMPIGDHSGAWVHDMLQRAGLRQISDTTPVTRLNRPIECTMGDRIARLKPCEDGEKPTITVTADYRGAKHGLAGIGVQHYTWGWGDNTQFVTTARSVTTVRDYRLFAAATKVFWLLPDVPFGHWLAHLNGIVGPLPRLQMEYKETQQLVYDRNGDLVWCGGRPARKNEVAAHQLLDFAGDMMAHCGHLPYGHIELIKPGHVLNQMFAQAYLDRMMM